MLLSHCILLFFFNLCNSQIAWHFAGIINHRLYQLKIQGMSFSSPSKSCQSTFSCTGLLSHVDYWCDLEAFQCVPLIDISVTVFHYLCHWFCILPRELICHLPLLRVNHRLLQGAAAAFFTFSECTLVVKPSCLDPGFFFSLLLGFSLF